MSLILGFLVATLVAAPAHGAIAYNRTGAVAYAKKYACNPYTDCKNPNYMRIGGFLTDLSADCTNFVSQAMYEGGGLPSIRSGSTLIQWFYGANNPWDYAGSASWINVGDLYNHLALTGRIASTFAPKMGAAYSGATPGDLYLYDWGEGEGYSHFAMATSDGTFIDFWDPIERKNYNTITAGFGSKVAQHSTDRDGSPWNWGFQTETRGAIKSFMKTRVIHIADYIP